MSDGGDGPERVRVLLVGHQGDARGSFGRMLRATRTTSRWSIP